MRSGLVNILYVALMATGIVALTGVIPALVDFSYPLIWWGLLPLLDAINWRRNHESLWRTGPGHFVGVTLPLSVLYWLLFEALNLLAPQWHYRGGIESIPGQCVFGFISFATVIPIVVECFWLVGGCLCVSTQLRSNIVRAKAALVVLGLAALAVPAVRKEFYIAGLMWIGPGLLLVSFVRWPVCSAPGRNAIAGFFGTLLAGFLWEFSNYWARTQWQYSILPNQAHLFEMPLVGYLGFVPFGVSTLIVYEWQRRIPSRMYVGILLYTAAFVILILMTRIYTDRGMWVHY